MTTTLPAPAPTPARTAPACVCCARPMRYARPVDGLCGPCRTGAGPAKGLAIGHGARRYTRKGMAT